MLKWIQQYRQASGETKIFIFTNALFAIAIVATTVYCYARLDFVRSYKITSEQSTNPSIKKTPT